MHRIVLASALGGAVFLMAPHVSALPSYKDDTWGVVPQDNGKACVVVLNSEDRMHAFHFVVDGGEKAARVGILETFIPEGLSAASSTIRVDFGPLFDRQLKFEHRADGTLAANLSQDDVKTILAALQSGLSGVSLSFANGDVWRIPGPKREAASAIARCWANALGGIRVT